MKKLLALCIALCVSCGFGTAYAKSPDSAKSRHATHSAKSSHAKHGGAHKKSAKKAGHKKSHGKHHQA